MSKTNRRFYIVAAVTMATFGLTLVGHAQTTNVLVNDTWRDGTRSDPAAPTYAENNGAVGVDADADGDLESAWFRAGSGDLGVVTNNPPITGPNILQGTTGAGSSSWFTYFTQQGTPVTLSHPGDGISLTWQFSATGINSSNTSQGFLVALAQSPNRLTADGSLANTNYSGLSMFMNMGTVLNNANSFALEKWAVPGGANNLLGTSAAWSLLTNGAPKNVHGYDNGTTYTLNMSATLDGSGNLDITSMMTGGTLNGSGTAKVSYVDSTFATDGIGSTFDTFDIRPAGTSTTASQINTSLFNVDFITIPEPSTVTLVFGGLGFLLAMIRRRRS
jgi:hypothetical protein